MLFTEEQIKDKSKEFLEDKIIIAFQKMKFDLLNFNFPKYLVICGSDIQVKYSEEIQKELDKIDKKLGNYIYSKYKDYLTLIHF